MPKFKDLSGMIFHYWTVIERAPNGTRTRWLCRCKCGTVRTLQGCGLVSGMSKSCGCFNLESISARSKIVNRTHGLTNSRTYSSWIAMKKRCEYEKAINYANYGGRGIKVCERWVSFENFLEDMGVRPEGMTLDRVDSNGNYEPSNCRWATWEQQGRNRRNIKTINYKEKEYCQVELAEFLGISSQTIAKRIKDGKKIDDKPWGGRRHA